MRSVPELRKHAWIIDCLGYAGMSSDETDRGVAVRHYRVKKKEWRAPELCPFLHTIDRVTARTKDAISSRGTQKYYRLPGEAVTSGGAVVQGLPINFYDATWLANLRANQKPAFESLKVVPNEYPLIHHPIILEYALCSIHGMRY